MEIWEKIKIYWRTKFSKNEDFNDESEHIIGFEKNSDSIVIIGYFHRSWLGISARAIIEYVDFMKKIGKEKGYSIIKIIHLSNQSLSEIREVPMNFRVPLRSLGGSNSGIQFVPHASILDLPRDIEFYLVTHSHGSQSINLVLEEIEKSAKISAKLTKAQLPWYYNLGVEVVNDSRFENWEKYLKAGYKREWYDSNYSKNSFLNYWQSDFHSMDCYIDERLMGFYFVWKYDKF